MLSDIDERVSVIVPVYNNENEIERCIESLVNQTYNNIEIVCIDDGSTDSSLERLELMKKRYSNIRILAQKNMGVSSARNNGLRHCRGKYFMFVDADDYVSTKMVATMMKMAIETNCDIVSASYQFVEDGKERLVFNQWKVPFNISMNSKRALRYIYHRDRYKAIGGYCVSKLYRRDALFLNDKPLVEFDEGITNCEDVLFLARCLMLAKTIVFIDNPFYYYVQNMESKTHNYLLSVEKMSALDAYSKVIELFEKEHVSFFIIMLVKRFYTYRAILIARHARIIGYYNNNETIRKEIKRYSFNYIITSFMHPERIKECMGLMRNL